MTDIADLLRTYPLPPVGGDKGDRGTAVVVAGASTCPGAALLAATAALRAGAGRVQVVTDPSHGPALGVAVPELLVLGWAPGAPVPTAVARRLESAAAVLVGPGLEGEVVDLAVAVAEHVPEDVPLLLDAHALPAAAPLRDRRPLVLPNAQEAVDLVTALDLDAGGDVEDPVDLGRCLLEAVGAPVAVRGEETVVLDGGGEWRSTGDRGLGTAGSGDVLVGVAVGLLARGLPPIAAVGWAVAVHAAAGRRLGDGRDNPGYLARELLDVLPTAIETLASSG